MSRQRLEGRPKSGKLTVPYMVDESKHPIDFKAVDADHVKRCATARRCGVCGGKIRSGPIAFIGPDTDTGGGRLHYGHCFADPWMHQDCAERAMRECPFLASRKGWRAELGPVDEALIGAHAHSMALFLADDCRAHRDQLGNWHFEAVGAVRRMEAGQ